MRTITWYVLALVAFMVVQNALAQEDYKDRVATLKNQKEKITEQEKEALKFEVEQINKRLESGDIGAAEANELKRQAAEKRALNIENRVAIIDNQIGLLERNEGILLPEIPYDGIGPTSVELGIMVDGQPLEQYLFGENKKDIRYDRRTYSDLVLAIGLNNAIVEGQSLQDTPYKVGGSRFFEMGWQWRTRVFKNSNFLRFNYGFSFQFNGLKPKDNRYFVSTEEGQTQLEEFDFDLDKSKFRMDNLVFPFHLELGPSTLKKTEKTMRYSLANQVRIGIGGYGGFNMGTRQKLKYDRNGDHVKDKLKRGYNTNDFIYGLSAYAGFDDE